MVHAVGYGNQTLKRGDTVVDTRREDAAPIKIINTTQTLVIYTSADGHIHYRPARFYKKVS